MVILTLERPHWIHSERPDDGSDQCLHGGSIFTVNGVNICDGRNGDWNVSAASLYLLRTLSQNHTPGDEVCAENFFIPCCGHAVYPQGEGKPCLMIGCNSGKDPAITHRKDNIRIEWNGIQESVPFDEWRKAIIACAEAVFTVYESAVPRQSVKDALEQEGWNVFWQEWHTVKKAHTCASTKSSHR